MISPETIWWAALWLNVFAILLLINPFSVYYLPDWMWESKSGTGDNGGGTDR